MGALRTLEQWFLWLMMYSFVGWVYESTLCSILEKKPVNRGFLNGPVCPIYGTGAIVVVWALGGFRDNVPALFLLSAVLCTALEYLTSVVMEKLFHARWWDYSNHFLNINGRVCLLGFVAFGAMAVLAVRYVHPWVAGLTARLSDAQFHVICGALLAFTATDLVVTLATVLELNKRLRKIREAIGAGMAEAAELFRVRGLHRFQLKRLALAFPKLKPTRYPLQWQKLLEQLNAKREELTNRLEEIIK